MRRLACRGSQDGQAGDWQRCASWLSVGQTSGCGGPDRKAIAPSVGPLRGESYQICRRAMVILGLTIEPVLGVPRILSFPVPVLNDDIGLNRIDLLDDSRPALIGEVIAGRDMPRNINPG
jgi:hypothetical protein